MGGRQYQGAADLMLPLGIAIALMAFSNAFLLYRLSTEVKTLSAKTITREV